MRYIPFVGQIKVGRSEHSYGSDSHPHAYLAAYVEQDGAECEREEKERAEPVVANKAVTESRDCFLIGRICKRIGINSLGYLAFRVAVLCGIFGHLLLYHFCSIAVVFL